jgi:hypothetical protein
MDLNKLITPVAGLLNLLTLALPWFGIRLEGMSDLPPDRGYRFIKGGTIADLLLMVGFICGSLALIFLSLLPIPLKRVVLLFFSAFCFLCLIAIRIHTEVHLSRMFADSHPDTFWAYGWYLALLFSFAAFVGAWVYQLKNNPRPGE